MIITNSEGREFFVRVVMKGDRWGAGDKLVHEKDAPMIEFYDRTYLAKPAFQPRGQFVERYYASTLAEHREGAGLSLNEGIPVWKIDGRALTPVIEMAKKLVASRAPAGAPTTNIHAALRAQGTRLVEDEYTPEEARRLREGMSRE